MDDPSRISLEYFYSENIGTIHRTYPKFFRAYINQMFAFGKEVVFLRNQVQRLTNENIALKKKFLLWGGVEKGNRVKINKNIDERRRFVLDRLKKYLMQLAKYTHEDDDVGLMYVKYCLQKSPVVLHYVTTKMQLEFIKQTNSDLLDMYRDVERMESLVMSGIRYTWSRRAWNNFNEGVT